MVMSPGLWSDGRVSTGGSVTLFEGATGESPVGRSDETTLAQATGLLVAGLLTDRAIEAAQSQGRIRLEPTLVHEP
jgi:hypothetical protein